MIRVPKTLEKSCDRYKDIWSNKNELRADQVFISSGVKFWFNLIYGKKKLTGKNT
jgi:hypothetical protein